jgi:aspartyl-tRNA(Asn)/glutamyl-tRNA(Gln) amidotransferase subunit B
MGICSAERAYATLAPYYDEFTRHHQHDVWLERLETLARAHGLRGRRVLDVGCGTGKSLLPLVRRGYDGAGCDLSAGMLARARAALPELPAARAERFERDLGLTADSAKLLAWRAELGDYFEAALSDNGVEPQPLANWVNELVARIEVEDPAESKVQPGALATLVGLVSEKKVTQNAAKQVLDRLVAEGGDPAQIVEAEGLAAIGGGDELDPVVQAALDANPEIAERLRGGDMKPIGVIIGHVMRETRGRADGGEVTRLVREKLGL